MSATAFGRSNYEQYGGIENAPDWLLRYLAPMACMEKERAELCRRIRELQEASCSTQSA